MSTNANVLFVGSGVSAQCWFRVALPARALGADWIGVDGEPSELRIRGGQTRRPVDRVGHLAAYEIVVLQLAFGREWEQTIRNLKNLGVTVLYEIDDYVHGIGKTKDHASRETFDKARLGEIERAMRACDGIICSTDYVAVRYRAFNANVWVCQNGIDLGRCALTRPERETVTIGWAGGTGHRLAVVPWLHELSSIMGTRPQTRFMSVGETGYAAAIAERYGEQRATELRRLPPETYPAAMAHFDIALAPATNSAYFRGKSDLRWLEASALGVPLVADPAVYPEIEDGVTGLHAATPAAAREAIESLVDDPALREQIGSAAREYVREHRSSAAVAPQWAAVLEQAREMGRTTRRRKLSADRRGAYLSVGAIFKDEGEYLQEWIEFHRTVGVEHFYLYDNSSSDAPEQILAPYIDEGLVTLRRAPGEVPQLHVYAEIVSQHAADSRWIAFIDIDEFLFPTESQDLHAILAEHEEHPALVVNWVCFGSAGHIEQPAGRVLENFDRRGALDVISPTPNMLLPTGAYRPLNTHVKSIVDPRRVLECPNPHYFRYAAGESAVDELGRAVMGPFSDTVSVDRVRLNHYWSKSRAEYERKISRGCADTYNERSWTDFELRDPLCNAMQDDLILRYADRAKHTVGTAASAR